MKIKGISKYSRTRHLVAMCVISHTDTRMSHYCTEYQYKKNSNSEQNDANSDSKNRKKKMNFKEARKNELAVTKYNTQRYS